MAENSIRKLCDAGVIMSGKILEIGAGTGRWTKFIVNTFDFESIDCVEMDRQSIEIFQQQNFDSSKVKLIRLDIFLQHTELEIGSYDVVIAPWFSMTLSFFMWKKLLFILASKLKTGGLLIFDFMDTSDFDNNRDILALHYPYYEINEKDLIEFLLRIGLETVTKFKNAANGVISTFLVMQKVR